MQHDYDIASADANTGLTVRAAINAALQALATNNSGAIEPTVTYPYMWWPDTANNLLKIRNAGNTGWITVGTLSAVRLGLLPATATLDDITEGVLYKRFTAAEQAKLAAISPSAEVNVNPDWNAISGDAQILNKPTTLGGYGITDAYTKTEVDNKVAAVYKYRGSVASAANLPADNLIVGDVYNVLDTGDNYAWTGTAWDDLGGVEALATAVNNGLMSKEDYSKLAGIEAGADVTDADNVGAAINGASAKSVPVAADKIALIDTENGNVLKTISIDNLSGQVGGAGDFLVTQIFS